MAITLPSRDVFWQNYPDYYFSSNSAAVKADIGGAVNADWITNTCALRMSRGLNYSGVSVPYGFNGMKTVKGGDGKRYAFRVREMRKWFAARFPAPAVDFKKTAGEAPDLSQLSGKHGIMAMDISFDDATGHMDYWNGSQITTEVQATKGYLTRATRITLWVLS